MKKNGLKKSVLPLFIVAGALAFSSCSKDVSAILDSSLSKEEAKNNVQDENILEANQVKGYLQNLKVGSGLLKGSAPSDIGEPIPTTEPEDVQQGEKDNVNGIPGYWVSKTKKYTISQAFDETILLDPTTDIIYPGCALKGNSIGDGTYAAITDCQLGDITFSINLSPENPAEKSKTKYTVKNIRKSDYQDALNEWATMQFKEGAQTTIQSVEKITNNTELVVKLGAAVKSSIADVSTSFGFNFNKKKNHILAKVIQKVFSVSTDFPRNTPTIFNKVDKTYFENYQPVYVSNINYGRILYLCIDTDESEKDVQAALDFAIKKIKNTDVTIDANAETKYKNILSKSDIHITMLGGGATLQREVTNANLEAVKRFLDQHVPINQLQPISFSLRFAVDNSQARVLTSNVYTITQKDFVQDFKRIRLSFRVVGAKATKDDGRLPNMNWKAVLNGSLGMQANGEDETTLWTINNLDVPYKTLKENKTVAINGDDAYLEITRKKDETVQDMTETRSVVFTSHMKNNMGAYGATYTDTKKRSLASLFEIYNSQEELPITLTQSGKEITVFVKITNISYLQK
jgi:putative lipoprotein